MGNDIVNNNNGDKALTLKKSSITTYTCPMHPEIKQDKPGSCPKCGMVLMPEKAQDTDAEEKGYRTMAKKFQVALILTIPVFILAMSDLFTYLHIDSFVSKKFLGFIELLLATPVFFYSGGEFSKRVQQC
jgi:cation transport ATPase